MNKLFSFVKRLQQVMHLSPQTPTDLIELLRDATNRNMLDANTLAMLEAVLQVSELKARDIMIPKAQMVFLTETQSLDDMLPLVVESGHSRFPILNDERDEVLGVLLAKDLLGVFLRQEESNFDVHEILRQSVFVPESKSLDTLLNDFRKTHNHMAIVVDEYGEIAGLVTIEDVLEQIVGEIEDEHDVDPEDTIKPLDDGTVMVKALTEIEDFNQHFKTTLSDEEHDTVGGWVMKAFGRLPAAGEAIDIEKFHIEILRADHRRVHLLKVRVN